MNSRLTMARTGLSSTNQGRLGAMNSSTERPWSPISWNAHVRTHPACVQNREWFALAEQAVVALHELYQRIGAAHLDDK